MITEDEIGELERVVEYLNDTWRGEASFKLIETCRRRRML